MDFPVKVRWQANTRHDSSSPASSPVIAFVPNSKGTITVFPSRPGNAWPDQGDVTARGCWPQAGEEEWVYLRLNEKGNSCFAYLAVVTPSSGATLVRVVDGVDVILDKGMSLRKAEFLRDGLHIVVVPTE